MSRAPSARKKPVENMSEDGTGGAPAVAAAAPAEVANAPEVAMEFIVDKLQLMNYEAEFCRRKKPYRRPLSRAYFLGPMPGPNASEQYFYFTSLVSWLLGQAGVDFPPPKEFDDPNATVSAIMGGLRQLGLQLPGGPPPPTKLTQGWGPGVVAILEALVDAAFAARGLQRLRTPVYPNESAAEEDNMDDDGADLAGDDAALGYGGDDKDDDEEEDEAYGDEFGGDAGPLAPPAAGTSAAGAAAAASGGSLGAGAAGPSGVSPEDRAMLMSRVDPVAWKLELERLAPRLRITLGADAKDWRSHLELAHEHSAEVRRAWPEASGSLDRVLRDLGGSLDKLLSREALLNDQFGGLMDAYKSSRSRLLSLQEAYNAKAEGVSERNNEMHRIAEQLEEMKRVMDERGSNISDTSPVVRIKTAIQKLSEELQAMEVRIGVVSHALAAVTVKDKLRQSGGVAAAGGGGDDDSSRADGGSRK